MMKCNSKATKDEEMRKTFFLFKKRFSIKSTNGLKKSYRLTNFAISFANLTPQIGFEECSSSHFKSCEVRQGL